MLWHAQVGDESGTGAEDAAGAPASEAATGPADAVAVVSAAPAAKAAAQAAKALKKAAAAAPVPKPRLSNRKKALLSRVLDGTRQVPNHAVPWRHLCSHLRKTVPCGCMNRGLCSGHVTIPLQHCGR